MQVVESALPSSSDNDLTIIDPSGHLTLEVMVATEEFDADVRSAIDRHVRDCSVCAQQQASLARAAQRIRRGRPRLAVPADARIAARQAVLRALVARRRTASAARLKAVPMPEEPTRYDPRPARVAWALVALAVAVAGAAMFIILFAS
ncbi:MAG: hypothetical protein KC503_40305 [Myxococcales bacterium]|nr:hypothetical protein [Myxococcales bacterium]